MDQPKRQHPLWMIFLSVQHIKNVIFPLVAIVFINGSSIKSVIIYGGGFLLIFTIYAVVSAIFEWKNFTYYVKDNNLEISDGRFISKKRYITLNKIQSIQEDKTLLHRIFGLASLTIVTGTSGDNSIVQLNVITPEDSEEIKALLHAQKPSTPEAIVEKEHSLDTETKHHYSMSIKEIILISITSLYFLAFIPVALTGYFKLDDLFEIDTYTVSIVNAIKASYILIAVLILSVFLISFIFGLITTYLKYGKYKVTSNHERIFISKGVISTSQFSIQKNKVHGIIIKKPFFRRLFGIVEVQIITLGDLFDDMDSETDILFPFININLARELTEELLPEYEIKKDMTRVPAKSLFLNLIKPSYLLVIITVITFYFWPEFWFIPVIYLMLIISARVVGHYNNCYLIRENMIQLQTGAFSSELTIIKKENIDLLSVNESWLERKFDVATLSTITRAKPVHVANVNHLPKNIATETYQWYAKK